MSCDFRTDKDEYRPNSRKKKSEGKCWHKGGKKSQKGKVRLVNANPLKKCGRLPKKVDKRKGRVRPYNGS